MKKNTENSKKNANETVEVLYQKMGDRWFAFSMIDDEVFVGSISQDEISEAENKNSKNSENTKNRTYKISGNS